jgi:general secretion pathway protein G
MGSEPSGLEVNSTQKQGQTMRFRSLPKVALLISLLCTTSCKRDGIRLPSPQTEIRAYTTALESFQSDCGRFPSTSEGLRALITRPAGIPEERWHGPYLDFINKDPWGHDYVYSYPGEHNTNAFDIYSLGPDGVSSSAGNDADDIANWLIRQPN